MPPYASNRRLLREAFWYGILPFHLVASTIILLKDHVVECTTIAGSSMSPTLSPNYKETLARDIVLWKKFHPTKDLQRGDIVFFSGPQKPEQIAVKRVIALGGDTVILDKKRRPKEIENGRRGEEARKWDFWEGKVKVPENAVWVEGDNWRETHDSNSYGPISKALIRGRAIALVWPMGQIGQTPWEGYRIGTRVVRGKEEKGEPEGKIWWETH